MTFLTRSRAWIRDRLTKPIPGSRIGIHMNSDTVGDRARLAQLTPLHSDPTPRLVRTTNNGEPEDALRIMRFAGDAHPVLAVIPFGKGFGPVGAGMALQVDNEPDAQFPAVSPAQYGVTFRSTMRAMRKTLPNSIPIVTAGFSSGASADWIAHALAAGASDADAVCFHVSGVDLVKTFADRLAVVQSAMERVGCVKPLWITEVGITSEHGDTNQAAQLKAFLALRALRAIERVYVYALDTDPAVGDYRGLCWHDDVRTPRQSFDVLQTAMARL